MKIVLFTISAATFIFLVLSAIDYNRIAADRIERLITLHEIYGALLVNLSAQSVLAANISFGIEKTPEVVNKLVEMSRNKKTPHACYDTMKNQIFKLKDVLVGIIRSGLKNESNRMKALMTDVTRVKADLMQPNLQIIIDKCEENIDTCPLTTNYTDYIARREQEAHFAEVDDPEMTANIIKNDIKPHFHEFIETTVIAKVNRCLHIKHASDNKYDLY